MACLHCLIIGMYESDFAHMIGLRIEFVISFVYMMNMRIHWFSSTANSCLRLMRNFQRTQILSLHARRD